MIRFSSRYTEAASIGESGSRSAFSSRSASRAVRRSDKPLRTHTRTVRMPSCFTASSRRRPQIRTPPGETTIGWSMPIRLIDSISETRSPRSWRWRTPTVIESTVRSKSTWPVALGMGAHVLCRSRSGQGHCDLVVVDQVLHGLFTNPAQQQPTPCPRESVVGVPAAQDDPQHRQPCRVVKVEQRLRLALSAQGLVCPVTVAELDQPRADELHPGAGGLLRPCLLYTSDAADDLLCVDLGGR